MLNLNKAEVVSELKTNKYLNVFLVASPILAIITRMIIESLNLDKEKSQKMLEVLNALSDLDDVQNIFTNSNLEN